MIYLAFAKTDNNRQSHHENGVNLVCSLLEKYGKMSLCESDFRRTADGKPYVEIPTVTFSVSHSENLAVCALWIKGGASGENPFCSLNELCDIDKVYFIDTTSVENTSDDKINVGIDIELIKKDAPERLGRLAKRYFHPAECRYIEDGVFCRRKFFEIWTKKESWGKMLGCGLQGLLSGFDVTGVSSENIKSTVVVCDGMEYMISVCFR